VGFDLFDFTGPAKPYCLQAGVTVTLVDAGPDLLVPAGFVNAALGDYHLRSDSPAIDQGDPATPAGFDLDGNPEPVAGRPGDPARADIGCYEFQWDGGAPPDAGPPSDAGVSDSGAAPVAVVLPSDQTVDAGATVQLSGALSTAPPGATLVSFQWTQVQGPTGILATASPTQSFRVDVPGTYAFELVVQDSAGRSSSPAAATILVSGTVPPPSLKTACGCGAEGLDSMGVLVALWALRGTRRAGRRPGSAARRQARSAPSVTPKVAPVRCP
jgi:hypothetical protein